MQDEKKHNSSFRAHTSPAQTVLNRRGWFLFDEISLPIAPN